MFELFKKKKDIVKTEPKVHININKVEETIKIKGSVYQSITNRIGEVGFVKMMINYYNKEDKRVLQSISFPKKVDDYTSQMQFIVSSLIEKSKESDKNISDYRNSILKIKLIKLSKELNGKLKSVDKFLNSREMELEKETIELSNLRNEYLSIKNSSMEIESISKNKLNENMEKELYENINKILEQGKSLILKLNVFKKIYK
ncbi:hypothetical protein A0H76_752 [Hepatospora eriocheir]|uniref:Uncharacterized protein n=1 Tax=Hepatospora eriocheir TaxID=1081669 RepID=A0A1X0Q713_9MICR|nr:hypothetical protein A0H76_752 [Hepatospora eriocheir]